MSESNIEWTDLTWNPVRGCRRVSPGCQNCYAEKTANRFRGAGRPYHGLIRINSKGKGVWTGRAREVPEKLAEPLSWRQRARLVTERQRGWDGESGSNTGAGVDAVHAGRLARHRGEPRPRRLRVFVNSMSDLFHEDVSFEFVAAVYGVMAACPDIDFLVLTKRPARMVEWYEWVEQAAGPGPHIDRFGRPQEMPAPLIACAYSAWEPVAERGGCDIPNAGVFGSRWPLPNVHVGVSVEDQQRADERIPLLLKVPAAVRWVSAEPLLDRIDLLDYLEREVESYGVFRGGDPRMFTPDTEECSVEELEAHKQACETADRGEGLDRPPGCALMGDGTAWTGKGFGIGVNRWNNEPVLDWVVVGGESGPGARPYDLSWPRALIEQCKAAGVPVFHKQLGSGRPELPGRRYQEDTAPDGTCEVIPYWDRKGADMSEWPADLRVREYPEVRR